MLEKDIYSSRNPRRMVETEGLVMSTPCDVEDAILVLMLLLTMGSADVFQSFKLRPLESGKIMNK